MSRPNGTSAGATVRWHPLALVPLALSAWVYYPITRVFFWGDDFIHLSRIANGSDLTFVLAPFGGHNLQLRNLALVGSWYLFGMHTELWYATVLLTHLLNVWLLFGVLGSLTASVTLACFGATLWGVSPLNVGTLAFYSVYGQVMATTLLLLVLDRLVRLGAAGEPVPMRTAWLWYALLLAGTMCFGTGVGVALVFPVVLFLLLPAAWRQPSVRLAYVALPAIALAAFFGLKRFYTLFEPLPFAEALHEHLAFQGVRLAPPMLAHLLGVGVAGSTLGYFFEPLHYPDVRSLVSIAGFVVGLGLVAWRGNATTRRAGLAMLALAASAYGVIAIGRSNVSPGFKVSPEQAAAALRYHYLGTIPIVVLLCQILQQAGRIGWLAAVPRGLALAAGLGGFIAGYVGSKPQIDENTGARAYVARATREIADAVAAAPAGTTVYLENGPTPANIVGIWLDTWFPGRAGVFVLLSPSGDQLDGRHVRFIERNPKVLAFWRERPGERSATLLVGPEEARP